MQCLCYLHQDLRAAMSAPGESQCQKYAPSTWKNSRVAWQNLRIREGASGSCPAAAEKRSRSFWKASSDGGPGLSITVVSPACNVRVAPPLNGSTTSC